MQNIKNVLNLCPPLYIVSADGEFERQAELLLAATKGSNQH